MKIMRVFLITILGVTAASAQTYTFTGLSTEDVLTIGRALDKLPREETDRNRLYQRMQDQITAQDQARAKALSDAQKLATDKAVAAAMEELRRQAAPQAEEQKEQP